MNFEVDKEGFVTYDDGAEETYDSRMRDVDVLLDMLKVLGRVIGPVVWSHSSRSWIRSADYYAEADDGMADDDGTAEDTSPPTPPPAEYVQMDDGMADDDGTAEDTPPPTTPPPDQVHDSADTPTTDEKTPDNTPPE